MEHDRWHWQAHHNTRRLNTRRLSAHVLTRHHAGLLPAWLPHFILKTFPVNRGTSIAYTSLVSRLNGAVSLPSCLDFSTPSHASSAPFSGRAPVLTLSRNHNSRKIDITMA